MSGTTIWLTPSLPDTDSSGRPCVDWERHETEPRGRSWRVYLPAQCPAREDVDIWVWEHREDIARAIIAGPRGWRVAVWADRDDDMSIAGPYTGSLSPSDGWVVAGPYTCGYEGDHEDTDDPEDCIAAIAEWIGDDDPWDDIPTRAENAGERERIIYDEEQEAEHYLTRCNRCLYVRRTDSVWWDEYDNAYCIECPDPTLTPIAYLWPEREAADDACAEAVRGLDHEEALAAVVSAEVDIAVDADARIIVVDTDPTAASRAIAALRAAPRTEEVGA